MSAAILTALPDTAPTGAFTPPGLDYPVQCRRFAGSRGEQLVGQTRCHALVGNVRVRGTSMLLSETQRGDDAHAVALMEAGVAHLKKVQSQASGQ